MSAHLLMATVVPPDASEELGEAEPVVVHVDPLAVTLTLDTGERIVLDRGELALLVQGERIARAA